jgi:hypothetical protein
VVNVLITDTNGAQGRDFYNVTVTLPAYSVALEQIRTPMPTDDINPNIKATVTGGEAPYTFIWTDVTTGTSEKHSDINSTTDTYKLAKSAPGTYEVKVEVTDSSSPNLTANSSIDLTVDPLQDGHVKCPDAPSGSTFMYDNNQYYVVDDTTIKTNISSQNYVCTTQVTNMTQLFIGRTLATYPGLELWDVSNVTAMNAMFYQASSFYQDISMWDVANVTDYSDFATDSPIDNTDYMPAKFRV